MAKQDVRVTISLKNQPDKHLVFVKPNANIEILSAKYKKAISDGSFIEVENRIIPVHNVGFIKIDVQ